MPDRSKNRPKARSPSLFGLNSTWSHQNHFSYECKIYLKDRSAAQIEDQGQRFRVESIREIIDSDWLSRGLRKIWFSLLDTVRTKSIDIERVFVSIQTNCPITMTLNDPQWPSINFVSLIAQKWVFWSINGPFSILRFSRTVRWALRLGLVFCSTWPGAIYIYTKLDRSN